MPHAYSGDEVIPKLSLLVPFRSTDPGRIAVWKFLRAKWEFTWENAGRDWQPLEIIEGNDDGGTPFSKAQAVNDAASRATGDVFAILDADVYVSAAALRRCAIKVHMREAPWMLPWSNMICLSQRDTELIIERGPKVDFDVTDAMRTRLEVRHPQPPGSLQLVPREAFELVGGYDERFRGWGGDDSSFFWAVETLWGRHQRGETELVAMWHPRTTSGKQWLWDGQDEWTHKSLEQTYERAWRDPRQMREVVAGRIVQRFNPGLTWWRGRKPWETS